MRILLVVPLIVACAPQPAPVPTTDLPFFGTGYRAEGDQCRRLGENPQTVVFLDHTADLVGCPEGMENFGLFAFETGGIEVARIDGFVLYSVPNG